jgi:protein-arginine kinase activator protein McsA
MNHSTIKCIDLRSNNRLQIGAICNLLTVKSSDVIFFKENKYSKLYLIEDGDEYVLSASIDREGNILKEKKFKDISTDFILNVEPTDFSNIKPTNLSKIKFVNLKQHNYDKLDFCGDLSKFKKRDYDKVFLTEDNTFTFALKYNKNGDLLTFNICYTHLTEKEVQMIKNNSKELVFKKEKKVKEKKDYIEDLNQKLEVAITNENFEEASILRDKISNLDINLLKSLEKELEYCIKTQNFEKAIEIRNEIKELYKNSKSIELIVKKENIQNTEIEIKPDLSKLEKKLEEYLSIEDYEMASQLRDKINKIKSGEF